MTERTWQIQGTVTTRRDEWQRSCQIPTFFVHATGTRCALAKGYSVADACGVADVVHLTAYCEETGEYATQGFPNQNSESSKFVDLRDPNAMERDS